MILSSPYQKTEKIEFRSTAQDGSDTISAFLGKGEVLPAPDVPKPDKIGMMQQMVRMNMHMGAPALKFQPKKDERYKMKEKWGMQMAGMKMDTSNSKAEDMSNMYMPISTKKTEDLDHANMKHEMKGMAKGEMNNGGKIKMDSVAGMNMNSEYNYDYLKSPEKTFYPKGAPVKEILLNLIGNMQSYIWSMNGIPLSETEKIMIKEGAVTRITLNNLTMMHHPMHLHGHFFRVINKNGDYSPLKHTVNVPPMQQVTIEFYGSEYGDWFFHCHILYHMMGGMARVFSYDTPRDSRLEDYPV